MLWTFDTILFQFLYCAVHTKTISSSFFVKPTFGIFIGAVKFFQVNLLLASAKTIFKNAYSMPITFNFLNFPAFIIEASFIVCNSNITALSYDRNCVKVCFGCKHVIFTFLLRTNYTSKKTIACNINPTYLDSRPFRDERGIFSDLDAQSGAKILDRKMTRYHKNRVKQETLTISLLYWIHLLKVILRLVGGSNQQRSWLKGLGFSAFLQLITGSLEDIPNRITFSWLSLTLARV